MLRRLALLAALVLATVPAAVPLARPAAAQGMGFPIPHETLPFLILDQDRLFNGSKLGQDITAKNEAEAEALRQEGQALDKQFEDEERALTERRDQLAPDEFRKLADAFDEKVVATRKDQEQKAQALADRSDQRRRDFFRRVGPILLSILEDTGAAAVIDQRWVLVAKQQLNITDEAIKRLDAAYAAEQQKKGQGATPDAPGAEPDPSGGASDAQQE